MVITEIGGTVGDIESLPFLEAARQVRHEVGRENCFFLHCSLVPYMAPSGELKTKPTQHSVAALRSIGISPDALILRCDRDVPEPLKNKIALMCDVDIDGVISTPDAPSIYDIPKVLHREELDAYVVRRLSLPFRDVDWTQWNDLLRAGARAAGDGANRAWWASTSTSPTPTCRWPRRCGPAASSIAPRSRCGGWPPTTARPTAGAAAALADVHGVLIPGGFGIRGIEGKIGAIRYARKRGLPVLGSVPRAAVHRHRGGPLGRARPRPTPPNSIPNTPDPVISTMADQRDAVAGEADLGGTMRLGAYPAVLEPGSIVAQAYQATEVSERHRHRYEVNNAYRDRIAESGLRFSGTSPDGHLVEFVEYARDVHPFLVGTQAHPELKSRPTRPHPLFVAFIGAALDYKAAERLPVEIPEQRANGVEHHGQRFGNCCKSHASPWLSTTSRPSPSETLYVGKIFALRADEVRMPRRQHRQAGGRRTLRRGGRRRDGRRTTTSSWSTSTAIPSADGCGSYPPACSTSAGSRRTSAPPAN